MKSFLIISGSLCIGVASVQYIRTRKGNAEAYADTAIFGGLGSIMLATGLAIKK